MIEVTEPPVTNPLHLLEDWRIMDTSLALRFSDEDLLDMIGHLDHLHGWGLIAELMKRYAALKGIL